MNNFTADLIKRPHQIAITISLGHEQQCLGQQRSGPVGTPYWSGIKYPQINYLLPDTFTMGYYPDMVTSIEVNSRDATIRGFGQG